MAEVPDWYGVSASTGEKGERKHSDIWMNFHAEDLLFPSDTHIRLMSTVAISRNIFSQCSISSPCPVRHGFSLELECAMELNVIARIGTGFAVSKHHHPLEENRELRALATEKDRAHVVSERNL